MNLRDQLSLLAGGKKLRRSLQAGVSEQEALQADLAAKLQRVYSRYDRGKIDADQFKSSFQMHLANAYEDAYKAGKGDENLSPKDQRWVQNFAADQFEYVHGFAEDLSAGNNANADARVRLYGKSVQAAYWRGSLSEFDGQIEWVLGPNENNCDDCVERADESPYDPENLPGVPGDGSTVCLGNCNCVLVEAK